MSTTHRTMPEVAHTDEIALTAATTADIDFLFELKSEADSVYWGGFAGPPEHASLKRHYEQVLDQGVKTTLVIRYGETPAGVISYRFDEAGDCKDYSINVSSRFAGRGIGRAALENNIALLRSTHPDCRRIVALIREDNLRSQRIFSACGYALTDVFERRVLGSDPKPISLYAWVKSLA